MRYNPPGTPEAEWTYKRRGTVLGQWHAIKRQLWEKHKEACGRPAPELAHDPAEFAD